MPAPQAVTGAPAIRNVRSGPFKYDNLTDSMMTGIMLDWQVNDKLSMRGDLNYAELNFNGIWSWGQSRLTVPTSDYSFDMAAGDVPAFYLGPNIQDVSQYIIDVYTANDQLMNSDQTGAAFDFSYDVGGSTVASVDFGLRFVGMGQSNDWRRSNIAVDPSLQQQFIDLAFSQDRSWEFLRGVSGGEPATWPWASMDPVDAELGIYNINRTDLTKLENQSYGLDEDVTSLYVQVNIEGDVGGIPYTANLGLRAENTSTSAAGTLLITGAPNEPIIVDNDYTNILPALNAKFELSEDLHLRVGLSQTVSRPDPASIAPITNLPLDYEIALRASGGNPYLDPYTATQLDITAEYFTESDGKWVASWFHKDVKDFIISVSEATTLPYIDPDLVFDVSRPQNFSDGRVTGFELGFHQPIGEYFGLQMNYTLITSSFDNEAVGDAGFGFPGASKDNFNSMAYYDNGQLSVRLSYTYRSQYFNALESATGGQNQNPRFTDEQSRVDAVVNYRINENFKVFANVTNITEEDRRDFNSSPALFRDYFTQRRGVTLGATYSF